MKKVEPSCKGKEWEWTFNAIPDPDRDLDKRQPGCPREQKAMADRLGLPPQPVHRRHLPRVVHRALTTTGFLFLICPDLPGWRGACSEVHRCLRRFIW